MKNLKKACLAAAAAMAVTAVPASAAIFDYTMTNGDVLSINTDTSSATLKGAEIDAVMTSSSFATFTGGELPQFGFVLDSLDGTRLINGQRVTDNERDINTTHPQKLYSYGNGRVNLWAWWGDPITGGDYITNIKSYSAQVPEPGALGLMALGLGGLAFARRRRRKQAAA
ncbi:PEP-CTERM sorting domain-containing protein [Altererythrobacter sp. RZ02]|uniref:PEP-CTERM sorting domain-containing protein n=1 Tax=Pontixanthobacter rizhaonensis TaxID=2730337 RepID=A0A848QKT4_9SPHN|nr:PEP-CTERM sorting domain-containing protein [Pontixanthobacter rizhaonensis]NMW31714.1 PEP-CTERM sorting domain-containing protein [Pontixanthobacter rizhaonensis]